MAHSKAHYRFVSPPKETKAEAQINGAVRFRLRVIGRQAHNEMIEQFSPLTASNAQDALDWQEARIQELRKAERI